MDVNKILNADILDILFDGKNKEYGAYQLRKNYPKTMTRALLITAALILLVFLGSLLANKVAKKSEFFCAFLLGVSVVQAPEIIPSYTNILVI